MNERDMQIQIERLLHYGVRHRLLEPLDVTVARNALLDLFRLTAPYNGSLEELFADEHDISGQAASPAAILEPMLDYALEIGLLPDNTTTQRDLLDARIMGLLMPRPSEVAAKFWSTAASASIREATDAYYELSQASNYIRMDRIAKNERWFTPTPYGELEITINLSKPEKDPREIALERSAPKSDYPKCLLCPENAGYAGRINHPARQNHRIVPLTLTGDRWFLQYSPYVYYNEHCIVLSERHVPMQIDASTFAKLLEFVEQFPHYFVGSNADLPIVGGSILSHDHFQGGRHTFPMEIAAIEQSFTHDRFADVKAGIVKWPMAVIRLSSRRTDALLSLAAHLLKAWRAYSDPSAEIYAESIVDGQTVPHNTITPIARMNADGEYELDLVLRNNRTSEEHPDGIFHPHQDLHHIKKENIGLIEVMGLAVLPGRLHGELERIADVLCGDQGSNESWDQDQEHPLYKHKAWIAKLRNRLTQSGPLSREKVLDVLRDETGRIFLRVLEDAGVFKHTPEGRAAFERFLVAAGFS